MKNYKIGQIIYTYDQDTIYQYEIEFLGASSFLVKGWNEMDNTEFGYSDKFIFNSFKECKEKFLKELERDRIKNVKLEKHEDRYGKWWEVIYWEKEDE